MAFVARAPRQTLAELASKSPAGVGPGSYAPDYDHRVEHAYAPFSSTAPRDISMKKSDIVTPGPGSYIASKQPRASNLMNQSAQRFNWDKQPEPLPGPGSYEMPSTFKKKTKRPKSADHKPSVMWLRSTTAPSIPIPAQAHGYEEAPTGELIPQKPTIRGYSGKNGDIAGPGAYDLQDALKRLTVSKGTDFGKSRARRGLSVDMQKEEQPGPGQYQLESGLGPTPKLRKPTATFVSRVLRAHQAPKDEDLETPGPGSYDQHLYHAIKAKVVPEVLQCFGSTSRRATDIPVSTLAPGPGAYKVFNENSQKRRVLQDSNKAGFASTAPRFRQKKIVEEESLPGPGQYVDIEKHDFLSENAKTRFGRGGHFGSTTRRFQPKEEKKDDENSAGGPPGPGAYETKSPKMIAGALRRGPSSVFASSTERFKKIKKEREIQPAPGQYEIPTVFDETLKRRNRAIVTTSPRFKEKNREVDPGPGSYALSVGSIEHRLATKPERPAGFGTSDRFFGGILKTQPHNLGPGLYNPVDPYGGLVKRSFNVTIESSLL